MAKSKKYGRFNGLSEEEVKKRDSLPDYLESGLDIVFVGINPSLMAAYKGRYYAGPGNHFYKLLHAAALVPRFVNFEDDCQLLKYKIGLTNIVERATRSSADLNKTEIKEGCYTVAEKLKVYKPKIAVFNGKCIYQVFSESLGVKHFDFGIQSKKIGETAIWVVPSSSARCSNFPRMNDKLHFYQAIKRHLQFLKGEIEDADIKDYYIGGKCTHSVSAPKKMERNKTSWNNKVEEYSPQFVVMEIHDGSNKNQVHQSLNFSKNLSEDDKEESSKVKKFSESSVNDENTGAQDDINSSQNQVLQEHNFTAESESEEEDTEHLVNLLKRKHADECIGAKRETKKSNISNIQKSLERFMYIKKS